MSSFNFFKDTERLESHCILPYSVFRSIRSISLVLLRKQISNRLLPIFLNFSYRFNFMFGEFITDSRFIYYNLIFKIFIINRSLGRNSTIQQPYIGIKFGLKFILYL